MDSLPELNWARLRVFSDGTADVFDCDGTTHRFASEKEACLWLLEDEFMRLEKLTPDDVTPDGIDRADLVPPSGETESELLPKMRGRCQTRSADPAQD